MPLIAAICPSCAGHLELDDSLKTAFCMYCGATVIVNPTQGSNPPLENYASLMKSEMKGHNYRTVESYCNKILEHNPSDIEALSYKGCAVAMQSRLKQAEQCWDHAWEFCGDGERQNFVDYVLFAFTLLNENQILNLCSECRRSFEEHSCDNAMTNLSTLLEWEEAIAQKYQISASQLKMVNKQSTEKYIAELIIILEEVLNPIRSSFCSIKYPTSDSLWPYITAINTGIKLCQFAIIGGTYTNYIPDTKHIYLYAINMLQEFLDTREYIDADTGGYFVSESLTQSIQEKKKLYSEIRGHYLYWSLLRYCSDNSQENHSSLFKVIDSYHFAQQQIVEWRKKKRELELERYTLPLLQVQQKKLLKAEIGQLAKQIDDLRLEVKYEELEQEYRAVLEKIGYPAERQ